MIFSAIVPQCGHAFAVLRWCSSGSFEKEVPQHVTIFGSTKIVCDSGQINFEV